MWPTFDYKKSSIRAAAVLTNSYVAATVLTATERYSQLILYVDFTIGSLTSAEIKVEFADDNSTFYQETFSAISSTTSTDSLGEHSISATGKYRIAIPIKDRYIKVSAKGTGTVTNSSLTIDAVLGI